MHTRKVCKSQRANFQWTKILDLIYFSMVRIYGCDTHFFRMKFGQNDIKDMHKAFS